MGYLEIAGVLIAVFLGSFFAVLEFLEKSGDLIAVLLGSLLAGLIAIYSVWKTNKNNIALKRKEYDTEKMIKENLYCGVLYTIHTELQIHDKIHALVKSEIDEFLQYFRENFNIPTDNIFSNFPVDLMIVCRLKILDFERFETTTLSLISNYINLMNTVQNDLNLSRIRESYNDVTDKKRLIGALEVYFRTINNTLDKLEGLREKIKTDIPEIIKSYPQSDVSSGTEKDQNVEA